MNKKAFKLNQIKLAMLLLSGSTLANAAVVEMDLMAVQNTWNSPGGSVTMWGFAADSGNCSAAAPAWDVGPELAAAPGDSLTINLRNCLPESVSMIIPGQPATLTPIFSAPDASGRVRVTSLTSETQPNAVGVYTWPSLKSGTYLYQSGTHPAKQVQMGLYGALRVGEYANTSGDVTVLYSEVDPTLHNPPTAANPRNYNPTYYLVNGDINAPAIQAGDTLLPTVVRMLNAGLDFHVPTLNGGYMRVVAEDGNPYPYPRNKYSAHLPAGKTMDALWQPAEPGNYKFYDRRLHGMQVSLAVSPGTGAPVPVDDTYITDEDSVLSIVAPGVLNNETTTWTATLASAPANGDVVLASDGGFTYTPAANFFGTDFFQYMVDDGTYDSVIPATVMITVNNVPDAPVALNDAFDMEEGTTLSIAAPGVLGNDSDVDGDTLTAVFVSGGTAGALTLNADGSFEYTPNATTTTDSFVYEVYENGVAANPIVTAQVNITVTAANTPPTANADSAATQENSSVTIDVVANDTDAEGDTLMVTLVSVPTNGTATINTDNTVIYTPNANFNGSDTFEYTISDGSGGTASASVNITVSPVNFAPVAVEDFATVTRNTNDNFINIVVNDTDADGNLANGAGNVTPDRITLITGTSTTRGGSLVVTDNGVLYTPRTNFRGTDTFNYTVTDLTGMVSNEVTVRINVLR